MCIKYEASGDKDMHKSGWMVPPRPNVPREIDEREQRTDVVLLTERHDLGYDNER